MAGRRVADWRFPTEKQVRAEETARLMQASAASRASVSSDPENAITTGIEPSRGMPAVGPADPMPEAYWDAVLADPVAPARSRFVPIQNRRLSEIPRPVLRVSCRRCDRIVEIQTADAVRLYGDHAIWKDVGMNLLDNGCQERTGVREDDGCWPSFSD